MADDIKRVPYPEHLERCEGIDANGQCFNYRVEGRKFCKYHGAKQHVVEEKKLKNYMLDKWRAQVQRHSSSSHIKDLREEIGILRMLLESRLNECKSNTDLLLNSHVISDMVLKIDKLVTSCHKIEGSLGELLDKTTILQFANVVIEIVSSEVEDQKTLNTIGDKILGAIGSLSNDGS